MAELVERDQQLQVAQLEVGAQYAVDVGHRRAGHNRKGMKRVHNIIGLE